MNKLITVIVVLFISFLGYSQSNKITLDFDYISQIKQGSTFVNLRFTGGIKIKSYVTYSNNYYTLYDHNGKVVSTVYTKGYAEYIENLGRFFLCYNSAEATMCYDNIKDRCYFIFHDGNSFMLHNE